VEGQPDPQGQRAAVVADEVDGGADVLAAHAAQAAAAGAVEAVSDLEERDVRQDPGRQGDDARVVVEDAGEVVAGAHQDGQHHAAQDHAEPGGRVGRAGCAAGVPGAEEVTDARGGGDAHAEGDRVHHLVGGHDDALGRERDRAQSARGEGDDLERPPLRADVDDAQEGEAREGAHVVECSARPATPALRAGDEARVEHEEPEGEPVGDAGREGGA